MSQLDQQIRQALYTEVPSELAEIVRAGFRVYGIEDSINIQHPAIHVTWKDAFKLLQASSDAWLAKKEASLDPENKISLQSFSASVSALLAIGTSNELGHADLTKYQAALAFVRDLLPKFGAQMREYGRLQTNAVAESNRNLLVQDLGINARIDTLTLDIAQAAAENTGRDRNRNHDKFLYFSGIHKLFDATRTQLLPICVLAKGKGIIS